MRRLTDFAKGLAGLGFTLAVLIGLPAGLVALVGSPVPAEWPGLDVIVTHATDGDIPDAFIITLLAGIAWLAWAQITIATIAEYAAIARGKAPRRRLALPAVRMFAAKLATWTTLLISALGPIRPAMAAPLVPITTTTNQIDLDLTADTAPAELSFAASPAVDAAEVHTTRYVTKAGDSWWTIAETLLGDGMRWDDIRSLNLGATMSDGTVITSATETVRSGWRLAVPADAAIARDIAPSQPTADAAPGDLVPEETMADEVTVDSVVADGVVVVEEGDHFWGIAEEALTEAWGRAPTDAELAPYWADVVATNEQRLLPPQDPNLIYPDQTFLLPDAPPSPDRAPDLNGTAVVEPTTDPAAPTDPAPPRTSAPIQLPALPVEPAPTATTTATPIAEETEVVEEAPTTQRAQSAAAPRADAGVLDGVAGSIKPIAVVAGGIGLLGGMLLFTLRRLRHIQAARRRPGTTIDAPDPDAADQERRMRAISVDGEDVRYLQAVNCYLSHQLAKSGTPIPHIVAMRAGQYGLEVVLDEACEPVAGFHTATDDAKGWTLSADLDARMMEAETRGDAHPFAPALSVVGSTTAGNLLVDFEQLGAVSIEGTDDDVLGFQRGIVAGLCASPWGTEVDIVAIGIDGLSGDDLSRVSVPDDPAAWAEAAAKRMRQVAASLDRSPYEERVHHGAVHHPTVVVIGPAADLAGVAQHLAPVADLAYAPLAVVSAHPLASEYRIAVDGTDATIEPLGISVVALSLAPAELTAVDHLIANASDTTTSPPTEEWADEIRTADSVWIAPTNGDGHEAEPATDARAGTADSNPEVHTQPGLPQAGADDAASSDANLAPSDAALARIAEILEPCPIEVRILCRKPTVTGLAEMPSLKMEAILVYLVFHRQVASERLREEFWTPETSRAAGDNAINRIRRCLGENEAGQPRLESARSKGVYTVSDEVGLDWHRVEALVAIAKNAPPADELAYLRAACELIDGQIAADASPSSYSWLLREPTIYTLIEKTLVDAAYRCGVLALEIGDRDLARWAATKGTNIVEGQEALYRLRMQAAAADGDRDGIVQAYREAQRAAESYGYAEEVQPETQALYDQLTRSRDHVEGVVES